MPAFSNKFGLAMLSSLAFVSNATHVKAQQRSIVNQGFEQFSPGVVPPPSNDIISDGDIVGWNSSGGDQAPSTASVVEVWADNFLDVASFAGNYFVELNPFRPIRLSQNVCLVENERISFSYAHRARAGGAAVQTVEFSAQGTAGNAFTQVLSTSSLAAPVTNATGSWVTRSGTAVVFNGPTGIYDVGFESLNAGSVGNFLDEITISPVALVEFEPASTQIAIFPSFSSLVS